MQSTYKYCCCSWKRASVWLPSSPSLETLLPVPQESVWKSPPQLLLLTGMCVHTLGISFRIERTHHHLPKARSLQLHLRGLFCRFSPFTLPNSNDFFLSAFWLCWLIFSFQNFKNWTTFEHPYLLPQFVSTP